MSSFDCGDVFAEHCFLVSIPRKRGEEVVILEVFGQRRGLLDEQAVGPECLVRARLDRSRWDAIATELRNEMNRRLKAERKPAGRWLPGPNGVQRLLGKEMLTLVWAIEDASATDREIGAAIRNWLGLKPEERWWLYTMTAASTGFASQRAVGWRLALRHALATDPDDSVALSLFSERTRLRPHLIDPEPSGPVGAPSAAA